MRKIPRQAVGNAASVSNTVSALQDGVSIALEGINPKGETGDSQPRTEEEKEWKIS